MRAPFLACPLAAILLLGGGSIGSAVTVDPSGVNIRSAGASTVFLTFRGLRPDQGVAEGTWCGEIDANGACVPGTIFGRLPARLDLSRRSGGNNFTDIMTIPRSVTRRAFQNAQRGNPSRFFYVRRFVSSTGEPDEFVPVTCRMASGGARSPLALTDAQLRFETDRTILSVPRGGTLPPFVADIRYNGTGRLKGRWEVVVPGDTAPEVRDLLSEGALPVEERPLQRRYTLVERFDVFLPPTGRLRLKGPDPSKLPSAADGYHLILLRIEATDDKEATSDIGGGVIVRAGGVAGFPMPVLRYYVGKRGTDPTRDEFDAGAFVRLRQPGPDAKLPAETARRFSWSPVREAREYELVVEGASKRVLGAVIERPSTAYVAPPWMARHAGEPLRWRVRALGPGGRPLAESEWRNLTIEP